MIRKCRVALNQVGVCPFDRPVQFSVLLRPFMPEVEGRVELNAFTSTRMGWWQVETPDTEPEEVEVDEGGDGTQKDGAKKDKKKAPVRRTQNSCKTKKMAHKKEQEEGASKKEQAEGASKKEQGEGDGKTKKQQVAYEA